MSINAGLRNEPLLPRSASFDNGVFGGRQAADSLSWLQRTLCSGEQTAVRHAGLLGGCAVLVVGVLGVINPLSMLSPLHFLTSIYLSIFAFGAIAIELDVPALEPCRRWVGFYFRGLMRPMGKGAYYTFLGTWALGLGDPISVAVGLFTIAAGLAALCVGRAVPGGSDDSSDASSEPGTDTDLARGAFKRRAHFGSAKMDSSELTSLCLELGLRFDARSRAAALDMLDPDQEGTIEEETFAAWWEVHRHLRRPL